MTPERSQPMHPTWQHMCLRPRRLVWQASDCMAARTSTCSSWITRLWQDTCNRAMLLLLLLPFACLIWAKGVLLSFACPCVCFDMLQPFACLTSAKVVLLSFACPCVCFDMRHTRRRCDGRPHPNVLRESSGLRGNTLNR